MSASKRKHFRHKTSIDAMVRTLGSFKWTRSKVHNLSRSGILLEAGSVFTTGDSVEIEFTTTDGFGRTNQRRFIGQIAWRRGSRYGVAFKTKK